MVNTDTKCGKAARAAALAAVLVGASVLAGWLFDQETLKRVVPGLPAMNPATAVAVILAGLSLLLELRAQRGKGESWFSLRSASRLCAVAVTLIGLAKGIAFLGGWDLGVDRWLFAAKLSEVPGFADRLAPNTALSLVFFGNALLWMGVTSRWVRRGREGSAVFVGLVSLLAILGYVYHIQSSFGSDPFGAMALNTAVALLCLSAAFLLSHTDRGVLAVVAGDNPGGSVARRLLPTAVLVPALIGWLSRLGEVAGIEPASCDAADAVGNALAFTLLIVWSAKGLFDANRRRREAEEAQRESDERFFGAIEHAPIGMALLSREGRWLQVNPALCEMVGYSEAELLLRTYEDLTHPDDLASCREKVRQLLAGEVRTCQSEKRYVHRSGRSVTVFFSLSVVRGADGKPHYLVAQIQDVTERDRASTELLESKSFLQSALDALSSHIAILDENGAIIAVNRAWDRFGCENGFKGALRGVGDNYLKVCESATGHYCEEALAMASGIRAVMAGNDDGFSLEYPCHGPHERRWFKVSVTRFGGNGPARVVVAHENISVRREAEEELQRQRAELRVLFDFIPAIICFKDTNNNIVRANKRFAELFDASVDEIEGKSFLDLVPHEASAFLAKDLGVIEAGQPELGVIETMLGLDETTHWIQKDRVPVFDKRGKVTGIIVMAQDITARKKEEEELKWKTAFLEAHMHSSFDGILVVDQRNQKILQNQRFNELWELPQEIVDDPDDTKQIAWVTNMTAQPERFIEKVRHLYAHPEETSRDEIELKNGRLFDRQSAPVLDKDGVNYGRTWLFHDITERKQFEAQLMESRRMETVGKLAGGVAHEFNSIMTAIIGWSDLMLDDLPPGNPLGKSAAEIRKAAERAAVLTRQLLAYGRKLILQPEILDLNAVLAGMAESLRHLVGSAVEVKFVPAAKLKTVKADAGQIEQVFVNMTMNAASAMPEGGTLTIETANVSLDEEHARRMSGAKPGDYSVVTITDTGVGMSAATKARVFEPFFTTKAIGRGAGLGLSSCYGIVKQSGGHISLFSEPGRGAMFKIYLPQAEPEAKAPVRRLDTPNLARGGETILLVEDDPAMREMASALLQRLGYTVLAAANGLEALSLREAPDSGKIDLLFTDVNMPQMNGKELADRMQTLDPSIRILFTSMHTENSIVSQGGVNRGAPLLKKPYPPSALAKMLREVLDKPSDG